MTKKTYNKLAVLVIGLFLIQLPMRKVIGEPFPAIYMPSFSQVPPAPGEPIRLHYLSFEVRWDDNQTQRIACNDLFKEVKNSHLYAIQFNFNEAPRRRYRLDKFIPESLFPGYGPYREQYYEDPAVKEALGLHMKERIEQRDEGSRRAVQIDAVWKRETRIVNDDSVEPVVEISPSVRFFPVEAP